jgi:hypothetical protein
MATEFEMQYLENLSVNELFEELHNNTCHESRDEEFGITWNAEEKLSRISWIANELELRYSFHDLDEDDDSVDPELAFERGVMAALDNAITIDTVSDLISPEAVQFRQEHGYWNAETA